MPYLPYPALLGLHLLAISIFAAGLIITTLALPGLRGAAADDPRLRRLRGLNRWLATPALVLGWSCGIAMALAAGWFAQGWLQWKLAAVLLLTGLHIRDQRLCARLAHGEPLPRIAGRGAWVAGALLLILILVLGKPALPAV